jgi:hypothetical protein
MPEYGVNKYQYGNGNQEYGLLNRPSAMMQGMESSLRPRTARELKYGVIQAPGMGTREWQEEYLMPFLGVGGAVTRAKQVQNALLTLKRYGIKGSNNLPTLLNRTRKRMGEIHPDKFPQGIAHKGVHRKDIPMRGFQELSDARDVIKNNVDLLRDYGIF